jgi:L-asparaginase II
VVLADGDGRLLGVVGDPELPTYVRSAAKPFQTVATVGLLAEAGETLDQRGLAIVSASHEGSDIHQIEAARLLALAGLDEGALRCPPALPDDLDALLAQRRPSALAHNCSGKHAGFLYAHTAGGAEPAQYLDVGSPLQRRVREVLAETLGAPPRGPGVDGCGAPAWVLPLRALAVGFARLAEGTHGLGLIADAMRVHPLLVGGFECDDTALMRSDRRVVAKRGAEAVMGAGMVEALHGRAVGIAVKVSDGSRRAAGPVAGAVLAALGARVPQSIRSPMVLGGGAPHGAIEVDERVVQRLHASIHAG